MTVAARGAAKGFLARGVPLAEMRGTLSSLGLAPGQQMFAIERLIERQAHTLAVDEIFYASAVSFVLLVPMVWLADWPSCRPRERDAGTG